MPHLTDEERRVFSELEERKEVGDPEESCDSCNGTGSDRPNSVCIDCLGQGLLLTQQEYDLIIKLTGIDDDSILDAQTIE